MLIANANARTVDARDLLADHTGGAEPSAAHAEACVLTRR